MRHGKIFSMFRVVHGSRGISFKKSIFFFKKKELVQMKDKVYFLFILKIEFL